MARLYQRAAARRDLVEHYVHLAENASLETAERFLDNVRVSLDVLADQPLIGAPLTSRHPSLAGMRLWRVKGFDNVLIFYVPRARGVTVVRVLHGARDWWSLLGVA